jgi:fructose-1,6-bisphosphatase
MKKWLFGFALLFLAACATSYRVTTDTLSDSVVIPYGFQSGTVFSIIPPRQDLLAQQISRKIGEQLLAKGYQIGCDAEYQLLFKDQVISEKVLVNVTEFSPTKEKQKKKWVKNNQGGVSMKESATVTKEWKKVPEERTRYTRAISLSIVHQGKEVWSGSAKSVGQNNDIREVIDYLLFSVMAHFGKDTGKSLVSKISLD